MIDPKFNKLTAKDKNLEDLDEETNGTKGQQAATPRRGLSINDTVARDANLSVGSRGVDTSGVISGAGAGAGQSFLTPGNRGESPAPEILPGPRSSGTPPRGEVGSDHQPTMNLEL